MAEQQAPQPAGPQVEQLTAAEHEWRDQQVQIAAILAERYTGSSEALPSLARLEATIAGWFDDDETRVDGNTLVNGVGIAFGAHIAADASLDWVIATDEYGSDLALHGQPGDILVFPANTIAKRVSNGETGFVVALHQALVTGIAERRALP